MALLIKDHPVNEQLVRTVKRQGRKPTVTLNFPVGKGHQPVFMTIPKTELSVILRGYERNGVRLNWNLKSHSNTPGYTWYELIVDIPARLILTNYQENEFVGDILRRENPA